jgi:hypothetical protein
MWCVLQCPCCVRSLEHSCRVSVAALGPTHPPPPGVKLNLRLAPRLIVSGAILLFPLYAFLAWTVTALPFRVVQCR